MAINLEMPKKLQAVIDMAHDGAAEMLRPISRKYDLAEHAYPIELDTLATLFEGISATKTVSFAGAEAFRSADGLKGNVNGANMSALVNALEISWGDVALLLSVPFQGLGNAAVSGVATDEQLARLGKVVLARDRPEHLGSAVVGHVDDGLQLLRHLQIDCHQSTTTPSATPMARRSRYHRSTGCSLVKP